AQNDRSLFTFLTSQEPYSLWTWLNETKAEEHQVPLLKTHQLCDYFIESAGIGIASRQNLQRWSEVKSLIDDHRNGDESELEVLKSIGILKLTSTAGFLRASRDLVVLSLCDSPDDSHEKKRWSGVIDTLIRRGLLIHHRQVDELRVWEGSDFDIDLA